MTNFVRSSSWSIRTLLVAAAALLSAASARGESAAEREQRAKKAVAALLEVKAVPGNFAYGERVRRVRDVVENIDAVLSVVKDPQEIMDVATLIAEYGVLPDVNSLEYWGEDAVTRAHLKPNSSAMLRLFDAAAKLARKQADDVLNQMAKNNNPVLAAKFDKLDELFNTAQYTRNMSAYFDCIATSPQIFIDPKTKQPLTPAQVHRRTAKKKPWLSLRKSMADETIVALHEFDDPAANVPPDPPPGKNPGANIQAKIRNMTGKLHMAAADYKEAKASFVGVYVELANAPPQTPPPTASEFYEARYFNVVCDILSGDLASALADKAAFDNWVAATLPPLLTREWTDNKGVVNQAKIAETNKGIDAARQMLQWRIMLLAEDLTQDPQAKTAANAEAERILLALRTSRPDMASRIDEQLANRMPPDRAIDRTLPAYQLLALLKRAMSEYYIAPEAPNRAILKRGIQAAHEIIRRKGQKDASGKDVILPQSIVDAMIDIGLLQEKLGNLVEAANAYLDVVEQAQKEAPKQAEEALNQAGYLILNQMKKLPKLPDGYEAAIDRFLPLAVNPPYKHFELAHVYAERLRGKKEFEKAAQYCRLVPDDNDNSQSARYQLMFVLRDMLADSKPRLEGKARQETIDELERVANRLRLLADRPTDLLERKRAIEATLILVDLEFDELHHPTVALAYLTDFKAQVKVLPDDQASVKKGFFQRASFASARAHLAAGAYEEAGDDLLSVSLDWRSVDVMNQVLEKLSDQVEIAVQKDRAIRRHIILDNTLKLIMSLDGYVNSIRPIEKNAARIYYNAAVASAIALRAASVLADDPPDRKILLIKARDRLLALQGGEMRALYLAQPEIQSQIKLKTLDPADPDPRVALSLAFTYHDLGDDKAARELFLPLFARHAIGPRFRHQAVDGEISVNVNDPYWEAVYVLLAQTGDPITTKGRAQ